jgi:zinc protease
MIQVERYGLPADWYTTYNDRLRSVSLEDAQTVWNGQVDPNQLTIVVVGDAASQRSSIEELGLSVVNIDAQGNPIQETKSDEQ